MFCNMRLAIIIFGAFSSLHFSLNSADEVEPKEHVCWNGVSEFATICYYTEWSSGRPGKGSFKPEDIDDTLCTHVIYSFALLSESLDALKPFNTKFSERVTALKEKNIKLIMSLGGWGDSTDKYSRMMADPERRSVFVKYVTNFLIENGFQGLDVAISYPGYYRGTINATYPDDKDNFSTFLRELRQRFDTNMLKLNRSDKLTLSVAAPVNEKILNIGYNVAEIVAVCDWISVMSYNFHGTWDPFTGINAPFTVQPKDVGEHLKLNVQHAMTLWLTKGVPANKLVVGVPCYGRTFLLANPADNGIHAPAKGVPQPGEFTKHAGELAFYEIIDNINQKGWTSKHNNYLGSYAFKDNQWAGYDDVFDVAVKASYIKLNCFYGASFWSLDLDCFQEDCPGGRYPLISTARKVFDGSLSLTDVENKT